MSNPDNTEWSDLNKLEFTSPSFLKPEYTMINIQVGSGSVIGESNIEQFLNFVRISNYPKKKPIAEIAPNYEAAITSLVQMLEARFVNMHPIMQHMFLALNDMIDDEKKNFVLKALHSISNNGVHRVYRYKIATIMQILFHRFSNFLLKSIMS